MCCSVLQCVAVCCTYYDIYYDISSDMYRHVPHSVLQYVVVCCSVSQCAAVTHDGVTYHRVTHTASAPAPPCRLADGVTYHICECVFPSAARRPCRLAATEKYLYIFPFFNICISAFPAQTLLSHCLSVLRFEGVPIFASESTCGCGCGCVDCVRAEQC